MKKVIIILFLLCTNSNADTFKLERVIKGLDSPWSLSFIDNQNLLITEKPGKIKNINLNDKVIKNVSHNLKVLEDGQGGLLDILYKDNNVFVLENNMAVLADFAFNSGSHSTMPNALF